MNDNLLIRLDIYLVQANILESRTRARSHIKESLVKVNGKIITKPSFKVSSHNKVELISTTHDWVSRGGVKLEKALEVFKVDVKGKIACDVGASTGGFSHVLLKNDIKKIFAIDCGHDQLHEKIKANKKVINLERLNARHVTSEHINEDLEIIVCDASFISLTKVLAEPLRFASKHCNVIALIKPQFELSKKDINKNGIVKDSNLHEKAKSKVIKWFEDNGWNIIQIIQSPIKGASGNMEFLIHCKNF